MPAWKPAYLIHGDDHGRIAERRARLRQMAEQESGTGGLEVFAGDSGTVQDVAAALGMLTFAMGRRFLVVDGVERWKDSELPPLAAALKDPPPETTIAFFGREEGRAKIPPGLAKLVNGVGGEVREESALKPWELPKWLIGEAATRGLKLDHAAAKAIVTRVGDRQQRLLREVERLVLELGEGTTLDADEVEDLLVNSAERQKWALADALLDRDRAAALRAYLQLRAQGESVFSLQGTIVWKLRQAAQVAARLEAGESAGQIRRDVKGPPKGVDALFDAVGRAEPEAFAGALVELAELEAATRGGTEFAEDTDAVRVLMALTR